jgi:MFS family permease
MSLAPDVRATEITRLRDLSPTQLRSGIAAWLGWLFDGLDMHLYTLVATPFVALLLSNESGETVGVRDAIVGQRSSEIQAAFLIGWALGGTLFGRIGDRLGRSRALVLTILTYAVFTGLSFFAQRWWHLLVFRFLAALGIGGEWAVGAALLLETWPSNWRHWIAGVLQSAVNLGVLLASFACYIILTTLEWPDRSVFLVGILPALLVLWIRRAVPEPEEWQAAKEQTGGHQPRFRDLFAPEVRRTTVLVILVCATALSAHWAFMFWFPQQLRNLPEVASRPETEKSALASTGLALVMMAAIIGNFAAGYFAKVVGYRMALVLMLLAYFASMCFTYGVAHQRTAMYWWLIAPGLAQGLFALFAMYLPPLFPTLLRTTGAGFCYNIGRVAAAFGTVFFGTTFSAAGDYRLALFYSGFLFLPAAAFAMLLPDLPRERYEAELID